MTKTTFVFMVILSILALLGLMMLGTLIHETTHVIQGGESVRSVCLDFNMKINDTVQEGYLAAHTVFDISGWESVEEFNTWRELQERWTELIVEYITIPLAFSVGMMWAVVTKKKMEG